MQARRRIVCLAGVLALAGIAHAEGAPVKVPDQLQKIEAELVSRARSLLERYGTTFYALAAYIDAAQQMRPVVAERSAPLEPEAIAEALREVLVRIRPSGVLAAGVMLDFPSEQKVQIHLETVSGVCYQLERSYSFDQGGRVTFDIASVAPCPARLYHDKLPQS